MPKVQKVFAYITKNDQLLVFQERGFSKGGIQVPAGSRENGETLEQAVLRESMEETGLNSLKIVSYLGDCLFDNSVWGLDSVHHRFFFHLVCEDDTPKKWSHEEKNPSVITPSTPAKIIFDFRWVKLSEELCGLQLGHDAYLEELRESILSMKSSTE